MTYDHQLKYFGQYPLRLLTRVNDTAKIGVEGEETMKTQIINKLETCNCGCGGHDPWHRQTYQRVVNQTSETTGTVRLPFSSRPVAVRCIYGAWVVDRESIVFDR